VTKNTLKLSAQALGTFLVVYVIFSCFVFLSAIKAADTGSVAATVTAQNISLTVSDGTVAYGTVGLGSSQSTVATALNDSQTATNTGNVSENINIRGMNSTSVGVGWTLAATPGADVYTHKFCNSNCDSSPTWTALTLNNQTLSATVGAGTSAPLFDLQLSTPTSSTSFDVQTVNVTVQATL